MRLVCHAAPKSLGEVNTAAEGRRSAKAASEKVKGACKKRAAKGGTQGSCRRLMHVPPAVTAPCHPLPFPSFLQPLGRC